MISECALSCIDHVVVATCSGTPWHRELLAPTQQLPLGEFLCADLQRKLKVNTRHLHVIRSWPDKWSDLKHNCPRIFPNNDPEHGIALRFDIRFDSRLVATTLPVHQSPLTIYRTQVNLGSDLWVRMSVRHRRFGDLTDVTLADEDTNSILTDNANRSIQGK